MGKEKNDVSRATPFQRRENFARSLENWNKNQEQREQLKIIVRDLIPSLRIKDEDIKHIAITYSNNNYEFTVTSKQGAKLNVKVPFSKVHEKMEPHLIANRLLRNLNKLTPTQLQNVLHADKHIKATEVRSVLFNEKTKQYEIRAKSPTEERFLTVNTNEHAQSVIQKCKEVRKPELIRAKRAENDPYQTLPVNPGAAINNQYVSIPIITLATDNPKKPTRSAPVAASTLPPAPHTEPAKKYVQLKPEDGFVPNAVPNRPGYTKQERANQQSSNYPPAAYGTQMQGQPLSPPPPRTATAGAPVTTHAGSNIHDTVAKRVEVALTGQAQKSSLTAHDLPDVPKALSKQQYENLPAGDRIAFEQTNWPLAAATLTQRLKLLSSKEICSLLNTKPGSSVLPSTIKATYDPRTNQIVLSGSFKAPDEKKHSNKKMIIDNIPYFYLDKNINNLNEQKRVKEVKDRHNMGSYPQGPYPITMLAGEIVSNNVIPTSIPSAADYAIPGQESANSQYGKLPLFEGHRLAEIFQDRLLLQEGLLKSIVKDFNNNNVEGKKFKLKSDVTVEYDKVNNEFIIHGKSKLLNNDREIRLTANQVKEKVHGIAAAPVTPALSVGSNPQPNPVAPHTTEKPPIVGNYVSSTAATSSVTTEPSTVGPSNNVYHDLNIGKSVEPGEMPDKPYGALGEGRFAHFQDETPTTTHDPHNRALPPATEDFNAMFPNVPEDNQSDRGYPSQQSESSGGSYAISPSGTPAGSNDSLTSGSASSSYHSPPAAPPLSDDPTYQKLPMKPRDAPDTPPITPATRRKEPMTLQADRAAQSNPHLAEKLPAPPQAPTKSDDKPDNSQYQLRGKKKKL